MKKQTLKYSLIVMLVVFSLVPALIVGAVGIITSMGSPVNTRQSEFKSVSVAKAGVLETIFSGYSSDAAAVAKLPSVVKSAANGTKEADADVKAYAKDNLDVIDALVLNSSGTVIVSSKDVPNTTFENYSDDMPEISVLHSWEKYDKGYDAFFVCKEVFDGSKRVGYVCIVVSAEPGSELDTALSGKYLDGDARLAVIDREGNAIHLGSSGGIQKKEQVDSSLKSDVSRYFEKTASEVAGSDMKVETGSAGGVSYVCGIIPGVTSWRWIGVSDASAGISSGTIIATVVLVVLALLCCLAGAFIASKFVGNMHDMLKKMNSVDTDEGFSSMRFETKGSKSELGSIQNTFNDLLDEVAINSDRYRTIAALSDNMLFEWDFHRERMFVSDNCLAKFDINTEAATLSNGRFLDGLMSSENADKYKRDISALLKNQKGYSAQYQLKSKSGNPVWISFRANCITDRSGELLRVIGVMTDIDNEKKLELQLSERASVDFLSQLYNRSTFISMLATELDRRGPKKIGIMFLDVDDFKFINDRYGHTVGDEVIKFVADTIRKRVDSRGGFAGRFGGDEFVMCVMNQEDIENSEQIAMDIIDELYMGYTTSDGTLINVKASIGITFCPDHSVDGNELIAFSDTAMYFVKKNGKNNYHIYVPEDSENDEYKDPEGYGL